MAQKNDIGASFKTMEHAITDYMVNDMPTVVKVTLENFVDTNFEKEGYGGRRWRTKKVDDGRKTLEGETRNMRRDLTQGNRASRRGVQMSSTLPYPEHHQKGDGDLPVRQFVGPHPELMKEISRAIDQDLTRIMKKYS